jgi:hypothetical protein
MSALGSCHRGVWAAGAVQWIITGAHSILRSLLTGLSIAATARFDPAEGLASSRARATRRIRRERRAPRALFGALCFAARSCRSRPCPAPERHPRGRRDARRHLPQSSRRASKNTPARSSPARRRHLARPCGGRADGGSHPRDPAPAAPLRLAPRRARAHRRLGSEASGQERPPGRARRRARHRRGDGGLGVGLGRAPRPGGGGGHPLALLAAHPRDRAGLPRAAGELPFYDRVGSGRGGRRRAAWGDRPQHRGDLRLVPVEPHRPGAAPDWLEAIAALARSLDLWLISDETYEDYVFHGEHVSAGGVLPPNVP